MWYAPERMAFDDPGDSTRHAETLDERWLRLRGKPRPVEEMAADEKTWLHALEALGITEETLVAFQKKWWIRVTCRKGKYSGKVLNAGAWETITGRVVSFSRSGIELRTSANETMRIELKDIKRRKDGSFAISRKNTLTAAERRSAARARGRLDKAVRREEQKGAKK